MRRWLIGLSIVAVVAGGCSSSTSVAPFRGVLITGDEPPGDTDPGRVEVRLEDSVVVDSVDGVEIVVGNDTRPGGIRVAAAALADGTLLQFGSLAPTVSIGGAPNGIARGLPEGTVMVRIFSGAEEWEEVSPRTDPVTGLPFVIVWDTDVHGIHAVDADGAVLEVAAGSPPWP